MTENNNNEFCETLLKKNNLTWMELIKVILIKNNIKDIESSCSLKFIAQKIIEMDNKDDYPLKLIKEKDGNLRKKDWIESRLNTCYNYYRKSKGTETDSYILKENPNMFNYTATPQKKFKKIYIYNELEDLRNRLIDYEFILRENINLNEENKNLKDGYNKLNKEHNINFSIDCPVCLTDIEKDGLKYRGICGHSVCKECYDNINTDFLNKKKCPMCREDWNKNSWIVST